MADGSPLWSKPRRVPALRGQQAESAALGERHSVILLRAGAVAICGDGLSVTDKIIARAGNVKEEEALRLLGNTRPVCVPRVPCAT